MGTEGEEPHYKVVLLGNSGVGKTALVERVTEDIFQDAHVPTVGAQFISLEMKIGEQSSILELWDTAGQEIFRSLVGFYARDARGAMILYEVIWRESFEAVQMWFQFIKEQSPEVQTVLFGNKIDLPDRRKVLTSEGQELAARLGVAFLEGSAKTGENVRDAFEKMTDLLSQSPKRSRTPSVIGRPQPPRKQTCC
jgi:small GTP-binding protein